MLVLYLLYFTEDKILVFGSYLILLYIARLPINTTPFSKDWCADSFSLDRHAKLTSCSDMANGDGNRVQIFTSHCNI